MLWLSASRAFRVLFLQERGERQGMHGIRGEATDVEELLKQAQMRVVGSKQVLKAVNEGRAQRVFLGKDADGFIYHRLNALCEEKRVPVTVVDSMRELGRLCAVDVKAAAAALLK